MFILFIYALIEHVTYLFYTISSVVLEKNVLNVTELNVNESHVSE